MNAQSHLKKLSIIIPAYNKGNSIFAVIDQQIKQLKLTAYDFEIIVVNDGSTDNTLEKAVKAKAFNGNSDKIKIYHYPKNWGKGFALSYGFWKSTGNLVAFCDADLDLPAINLRVALAHMDQANSDIVLGSKRHPESKVNYPFIRRFMSFWYQVFIRLLFNLNVRDTQCGLKIFKREILETVIPKLVVKAFAFDLELLVVAKKYGFSNITESPIELNYKFNSTVSLRTVKRIIQDTLGIFYRKAILDFYSEKQQFTLLKPIVLADHL
jgi:glycosyltransferase involved in cell wall biosynthesis